MIEKIKTILIAITSILLGWQFLKEKQRRIKELEHEKEAEVFNGVNKERAKHVKEKKYDPIDDDYTGYINI